VVSIPTNKVHQKEIIWLSQDYSCKLKIVSQTLVERDSTDFYYIAINTQGQRWAVLKYFFILKTLVTDCDLVV